MSDVSVVSQEYKTASELSKVIDSALLLLKKVQLNDNTALTSDQVANINDSSQPDDGAGASVLSLDNVPPEVILDNLQIVLEELIVTLDPVRYVERGSKVAGQVPAGILVRLRDERRGDLDYYLEDLKQTAGRLKNDPAKLTPADLELIDHLSAVVDLQATTLFRRLMRR